MIQILLIDPKYPHNVGQAVRAASCFGAPIVWVTGDRVELEGDGKRYRLPREERMRGRYDVSITKCNGRTDVLKNTRLTPVAVELTAGAEVLPFFAHPEEAIYVFGPEDGGLPGWAMEACHRFVQLPMLHCANLASSIYVTLYDRHAKEVVAGRAPLVPVSVR